MDIKTIEQDIRNANLNIKAVLFDMDGVLYNSMANHAKAWVKTFNNRGIPFTEYDAYMREGMTGNGTIIEIFQRAFNRPATEEECKAIYDEKIKNFESYEHPEPIWHVERVLNYLKDNGTDIYVVTGSGQKSLIDKLNHTFPSIFSRDKMVTAFDVRHGKPSPEPYLKALAMGNLKNNESIVIENAPLGVTSAHNAKIFTIAVNTGILKDEELTKCNCDILLHNMDELYDILPTLLRTK